MILLITCLASVSDRLVWGAGLGFGAQAELSLRACVEPVFNSANTPWQGLRPCHGPCQIQDMLDLLNNT